MTQPKPLSPAAQAVLDAFAASESGVYLEGDPERLAAALRAAANQAIPLRKSPWSTAMVATFTAEKSYHKLLAIADELKDFNG